MKRDATTQPTPAQPSSNLRSFITLAVLIHLFIVFIAISSNLAPSRLQDQLLRAFSPYAQPLNLKLSDPFSYKLYHYTHGDPSQDNHFLEIEFQGGSRNGEIVRLPDAQWPGSANRNRYQALARMLGAYAQQENDDLLSRLLTGIAAHYLAGDTETRALVRVRRHAPVPLTASAASTQRPVDPNAEVYFETLYVASVGVDADGRANLTKLDAAGQVAPLRDQENDNE